MGLVHLQLTARADAHCASGRRSTTTCRASGKWLASMPRGPSSGRISAPAPGRGGSRTAAAHADRPQLPVPLIGPANASSVANPTRYPATPGAPGRSARHTPSSMAAWCCDRRPRYQARVTSMPPASASRGSRSAVHRRKARPARSARPPRSRCRDYATPHAGRPAWSGDGRSACRTGSGNRHRLPFDGRRPADSKPCASPIFSESAPLPGEALPVAVRLPDSRRIPIGHATDISGPG